MYQHVPIDDERSVHELRYLNVLFMSVPRYVSDRMPTYSLRGGYVQCRDLVRQLRLGSLPLWLGLEVGTRALRRKQLALKLTHAYG